MKGVFFCKHFKISERQGIVLPLLMAFACCGGDAIAANIPIIGSPPLF
jgi:hypothetical protein